MRPDDGRVGRRRAPSAPSGQAMEAPASRHSPAVRCRTRSGTRPRARGLRVVIHPDRGVVVTVPASRSGRLDGERRAVEFLTAREPWLRRHLAATQDIRAELAARGGARDGGSIPLEGRLHRVRVVPAVSGSRRSDVVALR